MDRREDNYWFSPINPFPTVAGSIAPNHTYLYQSNVYVPSRLTYQYTILDLSIHLDSPHEAIAIAFADDIDKH